MIDKNWVCVKGAVCKFLTLLKHTNTIICLQIFKKHAKLTYLFIWKTMLQSVIVLWKCAFRVGISVSVLVCVTRPLPVYPIVFRHPGLPVGGKHRVCHFSHGSCQMKGVSSCWCRQSGNLRVCQVWGGGAGILHPCQIMHPFVDVTWLPNPNPTPNPNPSSTLTPKPTNTRGCIIWQVKKTLSNI